MVKLDYGPWGRRYYHVLAYLKAKGLIIVGKEGAAYTFQLTELGRESARALRKKDGLHRVGRTHASSQGCSWAKIC